MTTAAPLLGFCSISALDRSVVEAARAAAGAGFGGMEVTQRPPHLSEGAAVGRAREAGAAVRDEGLEVVAYGSYLGKEGERGESRAEHEVALAQAMGAPLLRVWAEPLPEAGPDAGFEDVVALLRATCESADDQGISVVVERHIGSFVDTIERIERLFEAVDHPALALNYQVLDFLPPSAIGAQAADAARLAPLARYFHLKNYRVNPEPGGPLLPGGSLAEGALDYRAILPAALEAGYSGPMSLEFVSFESRSLEAKLADDRAFLHDVLATTGST
jgi:3-dehydroshikimate dehydratase